MDSYRSKNGRHSIISHFQRRKTSAISALWLLELSWKMEFCNTKCRRLLLSPCNYDLLAKVKEPLQGTRYNSRDELIRSIGRSRWNINKDGRADSVRRLQNVRQKQINRGGGQICWRYMNVVHLWISYVRNIELLPLLLSNPCISVGYIWCAQYFSS